MCLYPFKYTIHQCMLNVQINYCKRSPKNERIIILMLLKDTYYITLASVRRLYSYHNQRRYPNGNTNIYKGKVA